MPFAELMQYIIDYKRTGRWPFEGMSKNKKSEFRRKSRQFRLMDNGDLMRVVFKEGVPTGKLEKVIMHVEDQKRLLRDSHECTGEFENVHRGVQPGRHAGRNKTMDAITGKYYWLQMSKSCDEFIRNCEECQQSKQEKLIPMQMCSICGHQAKSTTAMKTHMYVHNTERPFVCDQCPAAFKSPNHLHTHTRIHTDDKPHKCPHCTMSFFTPFLLKKHSVVHTGERPYLCGICGQSFTRENTLSTHQSQVHHTKPWKHTCNFCGKKFVLKSTLTRHLRSHTGEKPFVCPHCDRAYSINYKLKLHIQGNEVKSPEQCSRCGVEFKWKCAISKHECNGHSENARKRYPGEPQPLSKQYAADNSDSNSTKQDMSDSEVYPGGLGTINPSAGPHMPPIVPGSMAFSQAAAAAAASIIPSVPPDPTVQTSCAYPYTSNLYRDNLFH